MNEKTKEISNELLNAYLDNELDSYERAEIMAALEQDKALAGRLCELRNIKELTQLAYSSPGNGQANSRRWRFGKQYASLGVAASLFLVVGVVVGWFAHDESFHALNSAGNPQIVSKSGSGTLQTVAEQKKVILHIDTAEPEKLLNALDSAEDLLTSSARNGSPLKLEIIANSKGLDLLRVDTTPHAARIAELSKNYSNLSILACNRAIRRLEEMGIKVDLVPEARIAPSALDQIIHRLKDGWVYIKV
jgi:uncharacterized protein